MSARKSDNFRKGTNAEKEWRIGRVAALKARNVPNSECVAYMAREWGVARRQAYRYLEWANQVIEKDWDIDRRQLTAELLAQLTTIAQEARKTNQPHVALGCINSIARIARILE
jgi:hypothetical protein